MVRNTASMQSLRDSMANCNIAPPASPAEQQPPAAPYQPQRLDQRSLQLCGNDDYTKALMTKVATGQASDTELAAFNKYVKEARDLPSINNLLHRDTDISPPPQATETEQLHWGVQPTSGATRSGSLSAAQDLQMQRMILNEQNKKRLSMARGEQDADASAHSGPHHDREKLQDYQMQLMLLERANKCTKRICPPPEPATKSEWPTSGPQPQGQPMFMNSGRQPANKHEVEQMLLEQQDKKRILMARQEQHLKEVADVDRRRHLMIEKEQTQMHFGTPDSTWERDRTRLLDSYPQTYEREEFEQLWKDHLAEQKESRRKSKGLAATLAANQASNDEHLRFKQATRENAAKYTKPFCDFLTDNPTVFHAVESMKKDMKDAGWTELSEREPWDIKPWGHYFVERNGSSLIAFVVGANYEPGNGAAILAGHVDALTAKLKPVSQVPNKAGYLQLGVAPYAGALNSTWWDRDLGIGGRVHVKKGDKIVTKLVKLDWPIAKIPTLAPHFGAAANGPFNPETQMVPIIGLEGTESSAGLFQTAEPFSQPPLLGGANGPVGSFVQTQPPALVKAITEALGMHSSEDGTIVNWELELFDVQPATTGGLNREFIYAGRIDDKLCSWAALQALMESQVYDTKYSSTIKVVGLFDDEEIGSLLRQGAKGNFLPMTLERAVGSLAGHHPSSDLMGRTYANSFMVSSDVTHAVNPNFLGEYLENHAPHLNVGVAVAADSNGHMTTDSVSTTILKRCADKVGAKLQVFQIRNDSRSGGTVGPMLSSALGVRAIDAGLPQLSMHSIRATTGALDPGLGVLMFTGFLNAYEGADKEFRE